jgi:hypothetical protein
MLRVSIGQVSDIRQTEMQIPGPLVPEPSPFEVEYAIEKIYTSQGIGQISVQVIQARGYKLGSESPQTY